MLHTLTKTTNYYISICPLYAIPARVMCNQRKIYLNSPFIKRDSLRRCKFQEFKLRRDRCITENEPYSKLVEATFVQRCESIRMVTRNNGSCSECKITFRCEPPSKGLRVKEPWLRLLHP